MRVILVTGISGSGKSVALNVLEDMGYYCVDNLPVPYIQEVLGTLQHEGYKRAGISVDARGGAPIEELPNIVGALRRIGYDVKVLFLNASTSTLVQRFSETRRRHPLSHRFNPGFRSTEGEEGGAGKLPTLGECIALERELMSPVQDIAHSIDTSELKPAQLRIWIKDFIQTDRAGLTLLFESFAFKRGVPLDADLVFDVRCLPNPHYDPELRPLTGLDEPVIAFLRQAAGVAEMIDDIAGFLQRWLPAYIHDNRSYLTVAVGCTGGQHRSVHIVETLAARFRHIGPVKEQVIVRHRSLS
jgi:UPF0042 nucleotide-binding protein